MYAIVDVETTGGKYNEEGITEIAIYKYDGKRVVDEFTSLVNPERKIQPFVVKLTGIDNEMVARAPKFHEVAKKVVQITEGCIIVAHNASFDYRMLRLEFNRLGYAYERESLCTVQLAQKLIPGMQSYSLGKLVRSLDIDIKNRHRASGDAMATVDLFDLLLKKDQDGSEVAQALKKRNQKRMDPRLRKLVDECPTSMGVYFLRDGRGSILYIGKSRNIRKRITQHFRSNAKKAKELRELVQDVEFILTGSELAALLLENQEIKKHRPAFNAALKKAKFSHGVYTYLDQKGYRCFKICKASSNKQVITTFTSAKSATAFLERQVEKHQLCQRLAGLQKGNSVCFNHHIKLCLGACAEKEPPAEYNQRADRVIERYDWAERSFMVVDRGRVPKEKTIVLIDNGKVHGYAFINREHCVERKTDLVPHLNQLAHDRDAQHIVQSFLRKKTIDKKVQFIDD